jgi:23S rRNA (guanosine2251-2'-O)-methyltransferase
MKRQQHRGRGEGRRGGPPSFKGSQGRPKRRPKGSPVGEGRRDEDHSFADPHRPDKPFRKPTGKQRFQGGDRSSRGGRYQRFGDAGGRPHDRKNRWDDDRGRQNTGDRRSIKDKERRFGRDQGPSDFAGGAAAAAGGGHRSAYERGERGKTRPFRKDQHGRRAGALWIYGRHAGLAAILNAQRVVNKILATESAIEWLDAAEISGDRRALLQLAAPFEIDSALPDGAVHQGLALEVDALPRARLRETCAPDARKAPVVVLDQITDPHNIGAIFRSAAAFGARAIIVQDRRTPPLAGALAKSAAGAVETVPCIEVVNIARALEGLKELGYFCAGLAAEAEKPIADAPRDAPIALVLGAEGEGLRRLVGETCDGLFRIPLDAAMESLNVSNAAAVALYEIRR